MNKKVLIIEDNPDNLRLISYALKRAGYEIAAADTGEKGLDMSRTVDPVFIVVDINLPGIDGMEVTRRLRQQQETGAVPIIAITSRAMSGDRDLAMAAGCTAYFEKPIDPLTIMDRIHQKIGMKGDVP